MADPKNFGRYQVKQLLGRGAMGVVYLADDPVITRKVAIKVILSQAGQADQELQARFEREFKSAGTLSHPNIVAIHDVGKQDERTFIAMEYVEGKSLEDLANLERCMPLETVANLLDQICSGLDYAHERSIVHRDIKPANIIVTPDGRAKITDFGVAKVLDLATTGVTQEGATIGTPSYMAPEQAKGYRVQGSADQFSVAVMVYRLLSGERPFMGDSRSTVMYKIVHEDPITLNVLNRTIPAGVSAAVMKALGKDPTQRFPTCLAFAAAVRVGLAGGTVELPADPNAGLETVLLDPHAASGADTVVVETAVTAGLPRVPAAGRRSSRRWRTVSAAAAVLAALGVWTWLAPPEPAGGAWWALRERAGRTWVALRGGVGTTTPGPTRVPVVPAPEFRGQLRVESNPPGASIWVDGADHGLVAPAVVALEGDVGQEVQLQLRRDGTVAAAINLALGPEMPAQWAPEGVRTPARFVITSAPPGARVVLDGDPVPGVTPVEVELLPGDEYNLRVELGGYRPLGAILIDSDAAAGPVVTRITEEGPAARAGLLVGDVISAIGAEKVETVAAAGERLSALDPEAIVTLAVLRSGRAETVEVLLGSSPSVPVPADSTALYPAVLTLLTRRLETGDTSEPAWVIQLNQAVDTLRQIPDAPTGPGLGRAAVDYWYGIAASALGPGYYDIARAAFSRTASVPGATLFHNDGPLVAPRAQARLQLLGESAPPE